ncbi:MAG: prepilin peptidase [Clostridia bacterium]
MIIKLIILCLLVYAAWTDFRERIIENWLTFGLILAGIFYRAFFEPISWKYIITVIIISFILYGIKFWAEGDVKLVIGLSFWVDSIFLMIMGFWYCCLIMIYGIVCMIKNKSINIRLSYPAGVVILFSYVIALVLGFLPGLP